MKKNNKKYVPIILFLLLTIFYFEYSVTVLWDSAHYMSYVDIFEGNALWNTWDVVRGPVFPLIIFVGNFLFGKTTQGLIMNTYIYYLLMLLFSYKILKYFFKNTCIKSKYVRIIFAVIILCIILNPFIFGFYHSLLTEFAAITFAMISCYLALLWLDCDLTKKLGKYIIYSVLFVFLTIICWFLKQPYVSCSLFVLIVAFLISIFQEKNFKFFLIRFSSVLSCIVFLVISIVTWNAFMKHMGNDPSTDRNPTNSLGNQLITAVAFMKVNNNSEEIESVKYINYSKLSENEKKEVKKLIKKKVDYIIVNHYRGKKNYEADYLVADDGNVSTLNAVKYILKIFIKKPFNVLDSYLTNYFSIIDIYSTSTSDGVGYSSTKKLDLSFSNEITTIGLHPYNYDSSNVFYMLPEMHERVKSYEQTNYANKSLNSVLKFLGDFYLLIFKVLFLLLPFSLICSIIIRITRRGDKKQVILCNSVIILLGFGLLHVLLHTVTGAIIDRYAMPAFLPVFLGSCMLGIVSFSKNHKKE